MFFLKDLQNASHSNIMKHRKTLIKVLVDRIYLYDDGRITMLCYNGDTTTEIDVNLIKEIEKEIPEQAKNKSYFLGNLIHYQGLEPWTNRLRVY